MRTWWKRSGVLDGHDVACLGVVAIFGGFFVWRIAPILVMRVVLWMF